MFLDVGSLISCCLNARRMNQRCKSRIIADFADGADLGVFPRRSIW